MIKSRTEIVEPCVVKTSFVSVPKAIDAFDTNFEPPTKCKDCPFEELNPLKELTTHHLS